MTLNGYGNYLYQTKFFLFCKLKKGFFVGVLQNIILLQLFLPVLSVRW